MGGPTPIVYALAVLSTIAATLYRPAHSALLPSLCHTGYELASANVVRGLLDSAATLVGPLLAALLLQFTGVTVVFAVAAGASLWAAALLLRLRYDAPPRPSAPSETNLVSSAVEGIRVVSRNGDLALIMGLAAAQSFTRGALTVLTVVVAIDLLGTGEPGVGVLTAAIGAGAVLGSLAASLLVGTRRLGAWFAVGVALWGMPVTLIGVFPQQVAALGLLACVGVGNALIDLGRLHAPGQAGPRRGAGAGLRRAGEPGRPVHRGRGDRRLAGGRPGRRTSCAGDRRPAVSGPRRGVLAAAARNGPVHRRA